MTISSEVNKSGPYTGDGANTSFAYGFKIYHKNDIQVVKRVTATGVETVLTVDVDYTVNSVGSATGTIDYPISGSPLPSTETLTIIRDMDLTQEVDFENQGGYYPEVVEQAFDRAIMISQQLEEELDRCVKVDVGDTTSPDDLLDSVSAQAAAAAASAAAAALSETDAETAATAAGDAQTAAEAAQTAAELAETNAGNAQTAAEAAQTAAETAYDDFDDRYLGAKASDPALDNDGDPLATGALYFNTASNVLKIYNGGSWQQASTGVYLDADTTDNLTVGFTTDVETLASNTITADFQTEGLKSRAVTGNVTLNVPTTGNGVAHIKLAADSSGPYTVTLGSGVTALGDIPDLAASTTYIATIIRFGTSDAYVEIVEAG